MSRYKVTVKGAEYDVTLLRRSNDAIAFEVNDESYHVELKPLIEIQSNAFHGVGTVISAPASEGKQAAPGQVLAPMPGVVSHVTVNVGDSVSPGDTLLVIEAMKMENNIPSPVAGEVQEISVAAGAEVNKDELLITIHPA